MSSKQITGQTTRTQTVQLIDNNGNALGTSAAPLQTATSNLQTISDLTKIIFPAITAATTSTLSTASPGVSTRVYRMRIYVAGANVLTFTDATGSEEIPFGGAGFILMDFNTRPWFMTAANTAFTVTTSTAARVTITLEITKVA